MQEKGRRRKDEDEDEDEGMDADTQKKGLIKFIPGVRLGIATTSR